MSIGHCRVQSELTIDGLDTAGNGVGALSGRLVAVPFTIPGERVRVETGRGGGRARLLEVLLASPYRVKPRCRHFGPDAERGVGACGGCTWQHIAYPEQLRLKTALVAELVRAAAPDTPPLAMLAPTPVDDPWHYRQKVHFIFATRWARHRADSLAMGHYIRGSRRIVPVQECPVHDSRGNALAFRLRDRFAKSHVVAAGNDTGGELAGVAIRVALRTGEMLATVVATGTEDRSLRRATRAAMADSPEVAFHLNLHPKRNAYIFGDETRRLRGADRVREEVAGIAFLISPTAFFQTNVAAAELLVKLVLDAVPPRSRVLDLYAGAGLFALPLARAGHTVIAVEENGAAVADGEASARLNRIDPAHCRFIAKQAEAAIGGIPPVDVVVLDPPRQGCTTAVLEGVFGALRPRMGVYVSCNPETLAADLRHIVRYGYRVRSIQPVDMFPHTPHIETVVTLTR